MSNIHTPSEHLKVVHGLSNAITAAGNNGAGIDTLGFEDALAIVYAAPTGSGTTSDFKLQDADADTGYADVTGGVFTQLTTVGGAKQYVMNIKLSNRKRWIRIVHTGAGGSAAGTAYAVVVLVNPRIAPVSQANTAVSV